ncbi:MAG: OmpH family outer membrane protein [Bacteroidales bacterium]|nr:OmpH family outer membrane protein [Bacteroidales bacterium]
MTAGTNEDHQAGAEANQVIKRSQGGHLPWLIHIILLAGLVVLYILYFTGRGPQKPPVLPVPEARPAGGPAPEIAFVNSDVILERYKLVTRLKDQLDREEARREEELKTRQKAYEEDAAYFQEQIAAQSISESSAQQIYEKLMMEQEALFRLRDQYAAEIAEKELELNIVLLDSVTNFLERLNLTEGYDYILNYNSGGSILLARDTFDITPVVLDGLNREYDALHSGKK